MSVLFFSSVFPSHELEIYDWAIYWMEEGAMYESVCRGMRLETRVVQISYEGNYLERSNRSPASSGMCIYCIRHRRAVLFEVDCLLWKMQCLIGLFIFNLFFLRDTGSHTYIHESLDVDDNR
jgi:hypothetical protein